MGFRCWGRHNQRKGRKLVLLQILLHWEGWHLVNWCDCLCLAYWCPTFQWFSRTKNIDEWNQKLPCWPRRMEEQLLEWKQATHFWSVTLQECRQRLRRARGNWNIYKKVLATWSKKEVWHLVLSQWRSMDAQNSTITYRWHYQGRPWYYFRDSQNRKEQS